MKKTVFVICLVAGLLSCTRETMKTTVTVQLPAYQGKPADAVYAKGTGFNASLNPSAVSDINCYGIFVGGPETFLSQNNCTDTTTNTVKMKFGPSRFFIPAGTETSIDVPSGPARKIYLVGLKTQGTACTPMMQGQNPDFSNMSVPHIVSEQTLDLQPGDVTVSMTRSIDSSKTFDNCNFISGGGGTTPANLFGNARDGNLTIGGPAFLNFGTDTYSSDPDLGHSGSTLPGPATKKASTFKRIVSVDSGSGTLLTLDSAFTTNDFETGDEILWYVSSAWAPSNPDDNGCGAGSNLFRGRFGFANVVSTPSSLSLQVDKPISISPSSISATNLAQSSTTPGTSFCRIQVMRVPNFNTITVGASQTLNFTATTFNMTGGGIIAFRANEIILNSGSIFNIKTDGNGFNSVASTQGDGVQGSGIASPSGNMNGGGSGSFSGGGGAGSGDGGDGGGTTPGLKGIGIAFCLGATPCLPIRDNKAFFGGAGGGAGAGPGGFGGGIIIAHVKKISGSGTLAVSANGVQGSSATGGGAGGTVSLTVKELASTAITTMAANGANGSTGTYTGGGGGGGAIELRYCDTLSSLSNLSTSATGGAGTGAGNPAPNGAMENKIVPTLCN